MMKRNRRKRKLGFQPWTGLAVPRPLAIGMVSAGVLGLSIWGYWESGVSDYWQMTEEMSRLQAEITDLERRNQALRREITSVEQDPAKLEELARTQLGLVKKGEVVYQIVESK